MKENRITEIRNTVIKGFKIDEGPCIKRIQMCLNDIGVCHQHYYGGICVGNHVHSMLKVYKAVNSNIIYESAFQPSNVEALCSCVLTTAQDTPIMADAYNVYSKFRTILLQFSECHSLYDCNTIKPDTIQRLGKCLLLTHGQVVSIFLNR